MPKLYIPAFLYVFTLTLFHANLGKILYNPYRHAFFFISLSTNKTNIMGRLQSIATSIRNNRFTKYVVTLAIIILVVGFLDDNSFLNRQERIEEIEKLQYEISVLKKQYEEDTRKLQSLEEYENVERLAREKYLMKRPGEDVFVIKYQQPAE